MLSDTSAWCRPPIHTPSARATRCTLTGTLKLSAGPEPCNCGKDSGKVDLKLTSRCSGSGGRALQRDSTEVSRSKERDAPEVADLHVAVGGSEGEGQPVALLQPVEGGGKAGEARPSQLVCLIGGLHQCCSCQILRAIWVYYYYCCSCQALRALWTAAIIPLT